MKSFKFYFLCALIITFLVSCESSVPDGIIRIKNDSLDSEYNKITVTGAGMTHSLSPGEYYDYSTGTRYFTFRRAYKDFTRVYRVECPASMKNGILIKLIDVHTNRIAGNCFTTYAGKE